MRKKNWLNISVLFGVQKSESMMDWSISKAKLFQSCQRRWYFTSIARWNAKKEPIKREAYLLKSLQTVQGWRGSLVDKIIEKKILVPIMFGKSSAF